MKGGENRSNQRPSRFFCIRESRQWVGEGTGGLAAARDLADQVGASALPALEASCTSRAQTPTAPCTLAVLVLGMVRVCLLPGSGWAHIEKDQTNSIVQQQASRNSHQREGQGRGRKRREKINKRGSWKNQRRERERERRVREREGPKGGGKRRDGREGKEREREKDRVRG